MCQTWTTECPHCGMNGCSGGWGEKDGKTCTVCPEVYEWEKQHWNERPQGLKSNFLIFLIWVESRWWMIKHFVKHGTFHWYNDNRWGKNKEK